ncbi:hypothetical protein ACFQ36_20400 [Arthrobacter sp. GCM10027362]|uniref:hypothetical protein n=1 Tax=Arthrobacter sp. GCM10027362 TaxID=3273379 RepID=UPI003625BEBE
MVDHDGIRITPPETKPRLAILDLGLPEPVLDWAITDARGREVVWPDPVVPEYRVAVQYDGGHHRMQLRRGLDQYRDGITLLHGWRNIVIGTETFRPRIATAPRRIRGALWHRGWDPRTPLASPN